MPALKDLGNMTGPEILAYNEQHPGGLAALAAEAQGWAKETDPDDGTIWWVTPGDGPFETRIHYAVDYYRPTFDANQTRKLVEAVGEGWRRYNFVQALFGFLREGTDMPVRPQVWEETYAVLTAPLPLVTAAAVIAMGGEK